MTSCTIKGKPLVLSWGRTPRLDSDVRWAEVGPLSGKDPFVIVTCGLRLAWRTSTALRKRPLEAFLIAPVLADSTGSPSSTTVDQDAPSLSNSQTTPETEPLVIPNDVEEDNHDIEVAHMGNDPYFGVPIPEIPSDQSSSSDSIHTIWIYKVKLTKWEDFKNKAQVVPWLPSRGGIDFEEVFCSETAKELLSGIQIYVDDNYLCSSTPELLFSKSQERHLIFINQSKYALESLKKYGFLTSCYTSGITPMVEKSKLDEDKEGKAVDSSHYQWILQWWRNPNG
ncbi:hypothetical protein Tco_0453180 [Tanacetum coccineum]